MTSSPPGTAPRGRLLRKYVIVFVGLVGGVLMASSLVELYFAYQETKGAIVREERATAMAAAAKIEEFARDIERRVRETTRAASDDPAAAQLGLGKLAFRGGLGAALTAQRELDFLRLLRDVPAISELGHLDVSGKEQLRVSRLALDATGSQEDFSQAPKFVETRSGRTYWSPVYLRNGVAPFLTLAIPVGQYAVEVTTAEISLKPVQQAIAEIDVGRGGYAYVVDSRGRLFAHPDVGLVRQNRDLSALPQVREARAERPAPPAGPRGARSTPAATVAEGLQGGQMLAAHATIAPLGWLVLVERPLADAYAPLRAPILRSAVIFVLGLALSILASILLARRMVAPIRVLQEGAARIGAGDLGHRIEVRTGDELEALGDELNRTAGQLEESYANLEGKVEARTRELAAANAGLTETLEQQTATGEILRVISSSPTDVQPVFDAIVRSAVRLCDGLYGFVGRFDGEQIHLAAHYNYTPDALRVVQQMYPMRPTSRQQASARVILSGAIVHIEDVLEDPEYAQDLARAGGWRGLLGVPLLRDGNPVGVICVMRGQPGRFSETQTELLKTFADQAVIAIENVRLFKELEARTRDLTRSVGELRALGEVSQAVSSTLDLETVLETIVSRAVELSGSHGGIVYEFDETTQTFRARATHRITPDYLEVLRAAPLRLGEGAIGRAGVIREPVQVADIEDERQLVAPQVRALLVQQGMRSLLALPLVREDRLLGGLVIIRRERGAFSAEVVATLQTFAAQSVLAIHNAGLFREMQRQKQYSEALVETSPVAIATMDLDSKVVGWNPGAERLFGYTPAEALGRHMEDLVAPPEAREEVHANIRRTLEGEWIRAIARRARKDGTLVDVELSSMPVVVDGAKVGMIGIYHDITELLRARREAEAANEAKSAFLATMSHEIRTPLNAVIGMSGLLLNTPLTDEQREFAEVVRQSGDALLTVINDILDFSKIEAGKLELESQPFDLRECVEGALDLVATRAAEKGLDLAYLVGDGAPAAIVGDVTRLRQVLLNLLSNAVKFTERGEVVLSVSARRLDGAAALHELTFSVRDTGIGIPADRLGRLFQSFSQVDASTTRRYGGTGLGLAISQRLTELMSGRIDVTSEVGTGSDFRFTIRAAAAEERAVPRRNLSGVQPSLRGKRVLVVDDNATNRRILTSYLDAWGMRPRASGSPLEALGWVRGGEHFDVAILDMHMPEMDGVALARAIRQHPMGDGPASRPLHLPRTTRGARRQRGLRGVPAQAHQALAGLRRAGLRPDRATPPRAGAWSGAAGVRPRHGPPPPAPDPAGRGQRRQPEGGAPAPRADGLPGRCGRQRAGSHRGRRAADLRRGPHGRADAGARRVRGLPRDQPALAGHAAPADRRHDGQCPAGRPGAVRGRRDGRLRAEADPGRGAGRRAGALPAEPGGDRAWRAGGRPQRHGPTARRAARHGGWSGEAGRRRARRCADASDRPADGRPARRRDGRRLRRRADRDVQR